MLQTNLKLKSTSFNWKRDYKKFIKLENFSKDSNQLLNKLLINQMIKIFLQQQIFKKDIINLKVLMF